jgi:hypothetical protein
MPDAFDLFTIGHSNLAADRFVDLLQHAGVTAIADVRSVPFSRWCPWFSRQALAERLAQEGIAYLAMGDALGGRPRDPRLYRDGVADYEAMAATSEFRAGLAQVREAMAGHRVCLMCAEREPLECHSRPSHRPRPCRAWDYARPHPQRRHDRAAHRDRAAAAGIDRRRRRLFRDHAARLAEAYRRRARGIAGKRKP